MRQYSYENPIFATIKEPAKRVVGAYQNAARFLDTVQEWTYIETGAIHTAKVLHNLAHEMPKRFDAFGDMLHERHLMVLYPATPELTEDIEDLDKVFDIALGSLEEIQEALEEFRSLTDNGTLRPMALTTENFMVQNSSDYTRILEMKKMYKSSSSLTSFDNWVKDISEGV